MCRYCEEVNTRCAGGAIFYVRNGGANILYDPEDVGFLLRVSDGFTYAITHCPWCGRKLELPEEEPEFSAEDEIARLEGRINHTNTLLCKLAEDLGRWVDRDRYNIDMKAKVLEDVKDIRGKL